MRGAPPNLQGLPEGATAGASFFFAFFEKKLARL
jgi:hypothetical protein